ncbi:DUF1484 family protein [Ralstonia solanacearum]|uniref:DUF1484 family protein n=1 Tax=Ralstonia solanacearum TaxID=305 RepID=UPI00078CCDA6|nr:DUF1484 family protein [Ralstonia solanacearum]AMP36824.1 hypothetical protein LBM2029_04395 [Ralstonia solanacearum]AXV85633.1 DUF1484 domain-containing protein [Ralstonia solanacearum]AXW05142.1 DUF1484 domain-containing protein [Ralstonia solanacearum]AXW22886.1 DUF1484 domain-containing protein [Ralstonia solanacearum]AXW79833.1 DUF1484 domain-containing protein [Ralstonia solanacearum]
MDKHDRSAHTLALMQQRELTTQLASQVHRSSAGFKEQIGAVLDQLQTVSELIHETTEESCAELLRVSAGLDGILLLLHLQSDRSAEHVSLHCLLAPLKQQLDRALGNVHDML